MADLADVAYWVQHHTHTGETISDTVAATIADYWQIRTDQLDDDLAAALSFARERRYATIDELYALKAWMLERSTPMEDGVHLR
jgi:hypothetical protein